MLGANTLEYPGLANLVQGVQAGVTGFVREACSGGEGVGKFFF